LRKLTRRWPMKVAVSVERKDTSQENVQQEVVEEVEITSAGTADRRVTWQLTVQSLRYAADVARRVM